MWNDNYDAWLRSLRVSSIDEGKIKSWVIDWAFTLEELSGFSKDVILDEAREHARK